MDELPGDRAPDLRWVYDCDHLHGLPFGEVKALIGGKAANLAVMALDLGLPVPPAFTITTAACNAYLASGWPDGLDAQIREHMATIEQRIGRRFADPNDPLLVSVRSGAPVSMPGMMDTILNLGLNDETTRGLAAASASPQFAANCRTRFEQMFKDVVGGLTEKGKIIATFALCGFANFSSIGIQIGGIGGLAPTRKSDLARLGFRALLAGSLVSFMTAAIAGILMT